jgi:hypothetical protein
MAANFKLRLTPVNDMVCAVAPCGEQLQVPGNATDILQPADSEGRATVEPHPRSVCLLPAAQSCTVQGFLARKENFTCACCTAAGVPGMVGGMLRHLRSLRLMRRDNGW